ncbi:arabinose efflux permease family protein [Metallosphaera yellowstonensis MK1]|uniref:Arabinose efflux permease family protein n=1 Tax=Metallosphaera yellowstonensis MK1 TaxID=671065 RepID=H2C0P4_9CREN|nr:MFS transporter [Metallosphaera yellowstonensis]EHP71306.1 arabinose efflux permease family protein [Metallosphaera yellowstonensis MK1]
MKKENFTFIQGLLIILPITFVIRASSNVLSTSLPLLAKYQMLFPESLVGLLSGLLSFSTFLGSGLLNTRLTSKERRRAFMVSNLLYLVCFPLLYISSPSSIWFLSVLSGASLGMIMPNLITSAGLLEDRKARERLLSLYALALSLSLVFGPLLESWLLDFVSLREVFLWFSIFPCVGLIVSPFVKFPEDEGVRGGLNKEILRNPGFIASLLNIATYDVVFAFLLAFGGIFARETFHVSVADIEALFSLFFFSSLLARALMSVRPVTRLWPTVLTSVVLTCLGLSLMLFSNNLLEYALGLLILGVPHGTTLPISTIAIVRGVPVKYRNSANSLFYAFVMLNGTATPIVAGYLAGIVGLRAEIGLMIPLTILLGVLVQRYVKYVNEPK